MNMSIFDSEVIKGKESVMKRKIILIFLFVSILLSGCHYQKGLKYQGEGKFNKAIHEYEMAVTGEFKNDKKFQFSAYHNIGYCYSKLNKDDLAMKYFLKAADVYPEGAYYPYDAIAWKMWYDGDLNEAVKYSKMALDCLKNYENIEARLHSGYEKNTVKNLIEADHDFIELDFYYEKLKEAYTARDYKKTVRFAEKILDFAYKIDIGLSTTNTIVSAITPKSIAESNGIRVGDKLIEIDGNSISNDTDVFNQTAKLADRFGEHIDFKIERDGQIIDKKIYLYYPQLTEAESLLSKAKKNMGR